MGREIHGVITALRSRHIDDAGGYLRYEPLGCSIWSQVYPAMYGLRNIHIEFSQVLSNKAPCTPNRGYSRMQHIWFMERVIDICAHELGVAADEMRQRNYIKPEQMPYTTPNGNIYDSGDYPMMLEKAKQLIGYDEWKRKQAEARAEGRLIGIGIGSTVAMAGFSAMVGFSVGLARRSELPISGMSAYRMLLSGTSCAAIAMGVFWVAWPST